MIELNVIQNHEILSCKENTELSLLYSDMEMQRVSEKICMLNHQAQEHHISNPYLLAVSTDYIESSRRIMLFGQETLCWYGEKNCGIFSPDTKVSELQNLYDLFVNQPTKGYNSPFWNLVNCIDRKAKGKGVGIVCNNLAKIGYTSTTGYNVEVNSQFNDIVNSEIEILNPDIIVLLTGPRYDSLVRSRFGDFQQNRCVDGLEERKLAELIFPNNMYLNRRKVFRTYHPGYIRRRINRDMWAKKVVSFIEDLI